MKLSILALGALLTTSLYGTTLYDTLGPGNSFKLSGSTVGGPQDSMVADWIHPIANGVATSLTLAMRHTSGENLYRLDLVTPGSGGPTNSPFYSRDFIITGDLTTLSLQNGPTLNENEDFWLVISGAGQNTQGAWWTNDNGILGTIAWREPATQVNWNVLGDQWLGGVRIESGVEAVAAPEPATALLAAPALLLLGLLRRKRS